MRSGGCARPWRGRCRRGGAGFPASSCAPTASWRSSCVRRRHASRPWWRGSPTSPTPAGSPVTRGRTSGGSPRSEQRAAAHGAGEALLSDADGRLVEGAFTSLLWWEGETLCAVPDDAPILPGITRALLLELARDRGTPVSYHRPRPQALDGRETWLVSALHGIRVVTRWANGGPPAGGAPRAGGWQRLLDGLNARQGV